MYDHYARILTIGLSYFRIFQINRLPVIIPVFCELVVAYFVFYGLLYETGDLNNFVEYMISLSLLIHTNAKIAVFIIKQKQVQTLLDNIQTFWILPETEENFSKECLTFLKRWTFILQTFKTYAILSIAFIIGVAILGNDLSYSCYFPTDFNKGLFIFINSFAFVFDTTVALDHDYLFCAIMVILIVQFKMMNQAFRDIDYTINKPEDDARIQKELKKLANYHDVLLQSGKLINQTFGKMLIIYLGVDLFQICLLLYVFSESIDKDTKYLIKYSLYLLGVVGQLSLFYCIPCQALNDESENTINSIYDSNWYSCKSKNVKRLLIMIFTRSQKILEINAGGMVVVSYQTGTYIFRTSASFFTFLQNFKKNNGM